MSHVDKKGKIDWKAVEKKIKETNGSKPNEKGGSGISLEKETSKGK